MTFLPFLLNRSKLAICSYYFFLFWPLTLHTLKGSSTAPIKASQSLSCLFCLTGRGYIGSYNLFLFWPVPLKSVKKRKKKSIYACILINKISKKKKKKKYLCMYIDKKNQLKKKKNNFFLFCPVTLQALISWLIYSLSQHLTSLANDFPAFFAYPVKVTNMLLLFFSILA